ncbi:MAG: hypothetical protein HZC51_09160 [Nitrospirae bacterium]|nr:hypothetical protein [Nitrospirota bacterium]
MCECANLFEIGKFVASILTPIVVLILGLVLTRKIEKIRNDIAKEKEWKTKWSDTFYQTFRDLNASVEEIIVTLHEISDLNKSGKGNSSEVKEKVDYLQNLINRMRRMDFSLRTQLGSGAPRNSNDVQDAADNLLALIKTTIDSEEGDAKKLHSALIELNRKAMIAHSEVLGLSQYQ